MRFFTKSWVLILPLLVSTLANAELKGELKEIGTFSQFRWKTYPTISFSQLDCHSKPPLEFIAKIQVGKQGELKAIHLTKGSGIASVDKQLIKQLKTAEFYPFTKKGEPIEGWITLPIKVSCQP